MVVVTPAVVVVVDPGGGQLPPGPQASQQLATVPTQAVPPCGARQSVDVQQAAQKQAQAQLDLATATNRRVRGIEGTYRA